MFSQANVAWTTKSKSVKSHSQTQRRESALRAVRSFGENRFEESNVRKSALIGLTLVAAVPAALLCYVAILGIMTHAGRQQFTSKTAIVLYVTAIVSAMIAVWPPLWAIVWYGSPVKEADVDDVDAESESDAEVADADGEADAESFPEENLDAFDGQPPPRDDDTSESSDFDASDDDVSQVDTDDFQLDGDDEFGDLDFDEEEVEEEAPKPKAKAKDKAKKKKK